MGGGASNSDSPSGDERAWAAAYLRFESPEEETRKFIRRLRAAGALAWRSDTRVLELFCGRGNGLNALARLGFVRLTGVDLSFELLSRHAGAGCVAAGDARAIPLGTASVDVVIVQGGLHHLPTLPGDLEETLREISRVLVPAGQFVAVEPWRTPFLDAVHWLTRRPLVRRVSPRVDALATMIHYERETYERWLAEPAAILAILKRYFPAHRVHVGWGKIRFLGRR